MNIITLDFETYFDNEYTLSKMTTEEYIRDPRFEVHGASIRLPFDLITGEGPAFTQWCDAKDLHAPLDAIDWSTTALLCHHGQFEGLILSHHFSIVPMMYMDTMAMGRLLFGQDVSVSLASLAEKFDLPSKTIDYLAFKGKHWQEMNFTTQQMLADGCCRDVNITWELFCRMMQGGETR